MPRAIIHYLARASALALLATLVPIMASPQDPGDGVRVRHEAIRLGPRTLDADGGITAPFRFKMAGVSWTGEDASETDHDHREVRVRVSSGDRWGPWTTLEEMHDEGPDAGSREDRGTATFPVWVGDGERIQVRGAPEGATLHLIDPGPDPAQPPLRRAGAQPGRPTIVSRAEWGADESIRRGSPSYASNVRFAVVHHTATDNGYSAGEAPGVVRSIYAYHVQANGWDDIGYNALVDRYGRIYEGRAGGLERAVIGAHAKGFNAGSTGVALIGTFSGSVPGAAYDSLKRFLAWKLDVHHVDPHWRVTVRSSGSDRYAEGTNVSLNTIAGHRDTGRTGCPGDGGYSILDRLRPEVAALDPPKLFEPGVDHAAITPNGDGHRDTITITSRARDVTSWTVEVADAGGSVRRTATGTGAIRFVWDGKDTTGAVLPHGPYSVRIKGTNAAGRAARPWSGTVWVAGWPDGTFVTTGPGHAIHLLEDGRLRHVPGTATFRSWARWGEPVTVSHAVVAAYPKGKRLPMRDGTLFWARWEGKTYLVSGGKRYWITSPPVFRRMGFRNDAVLAANLDEPLQTPLGGNIDDSTTRHPNGVLLQRSSPGAYVSQIVDGTRRSINTVAIYESRYRWEEIITVSDVDFATYAPGPLMNFRDGTLIWVRSEGRVYVISDGLRRWVPSPRHMKAYGYEGKRVFAVGDGEASLHPVGPPLA